MTAIIITASAKVENTQVKWKRYHSPRSGTTHPVLFKCFSESHDAQRKHSYSNQRERKGLRPQFTDPRPLEKDPAYNFQEVPERNHIGDNLNDLRHVGDGKREAGKIDERHEEEELCD